MKTTVNLPDDLLKEVKLRAVQEGRKLQDAVADLLRKGLANKSSGNPTHVRPNKSMLKRRKELTRKFVSGEWGVELSGFEEGRAIDRRKAKQQSKAWRE